MGLYTGGLIYGWVYIRNGESVSKLVGLYMRGGGLYSGGLIFGGLRYSKESVTNIRIIIFIFNSLDQGIESDHLVDFKADDY